MGVGKKYKGEIIINNFVMLIYENYLDSLNWKMSLKPVGNNGAFMIDERNNIHWEHGDENLIIEFPWHAYL